MTVIRIAEKVALCVICDMTTQENWN